MAAILIFVAVYLVLAIGRLPGFRVDREDRSPCRSEASAATG